MRYIGDGYHLNLIRPEKLQLCEVDADHWKTWTHQRLTTPLDQPGALTLFQAAPQEHLALAKHLTAERKIEEFIVGRGVTIKWERIRKQNHWFDALYNACAAGYHAGVRLVGDSRPARLEPHERPTCRQLAEQSRQGGNWLRRQKYGTNCSALRGPVSRTVASVDHQLPTTSKRPTWANVGRRVPQTGRLASVPLGIGETWIEFIRDCQQHPDHIFCIDPCRTPTSFQFRLHGGGHLADRISYVVHGRVSYLARMKCPRSVFWNRASFPFTVISRRIAAYKVACGVLPPGLVNTPSLPSPRSSAWC